jgi:ubiquinone biosynthesis protein
MATYGMEVLALLEEAPSDFRTLLRLAKTGKLRMQVEHQGLDDDRVAQDRSSNRLAFAIVLASLIVGSSIIIQAGIPPTWHDIPLIGLLGYVVAGLMGFWLLISILRRGML